MYPRSNVVCLSALVLAGISCSGGVTPAPVAIRPEASRQNVSDFSELASSGMTLAVGQQADGELTAADYRWQSDGSFMQVWELSATRGESVTIDLLSDDFDSYLWLKGPEIDLSDDDGAGSCNSRITFTPESNTNYRIIVNTLGTDATGSFRLMASSQPGIVADGGCNAGFAMDDSPETDENSDTFASTLQALPVAGQLGMGSTSGGTLDGRDEMMDGKFVEAWTLELGAAQTAVIDLFSTEFDSYLWVADRSGVQSNDDGAGACNARLTLHTDSPTTYTVVATSFAEAGLGNYMLRVSDRPGPEEPGSCGTDASPTADLVATIAPQTETLHLGSDITGVLTESDATTETDSYIQVWEVAGDAGQRIAVELSSTDFDAYLWLVGDDLQLSDDDGGGNCNAALIATLPGEGSYRVGVTTFETMTTGTYRLRVSEEPGAEAPGGCGGGTGDSRVADALAAANAPPERFVEQGSDVRGNLSSDDQLEESANFQVWALRGEPGQEATVELISTDFDAYLWASGASLRLEDDDGAGNCNSSIELRIPDNGSVNLGITSFDGTGSGSFRLRVLDSPGPVEAGGCAGGSPQLGDRQVCADMLTDLSTGGRVLEQERVVRGTLTGSDARCPQGAYLQAWELSGTAGEGVTIDVSSDEFDTYMYLVGPGIEVPRVDDDDGGACNSRIEIEFPATGNYSVIASSFNPERTGRFGIRVTHNPPPPRTGACPSEPSDVAGDNPWGAFNLSLLPAAGSIRLGESLDSFLTEDDVEGSDGAYRQAWTLRAAPGTLVAVTVESEDFDTFVGVFGPQLTGVETDDDGGEDTNSRLSIEVPGDGDLTIVVSSFAGGETGRFTLSVEERERK